MELLEKMLFQRKKESLYQPKGRGYHLFLSFPLQFPLEGKGWGKKKRSVNVCLALRERSMWKVVHTVLLP